MSKSSALLKKTLLTATIAGVTASCGSFYPSPFEQTTIITPKAPSSVIICRSAQCAPARTNMTREFMYNSLYNLFDNNLDSQIMLCEADPATRTCFENYLQFQIKAGITPATVVIDAAKLLDVRLNKADQTVNIALDYNMHYNGIRPQCRASNNALFVKSPDYVLMEDTGYRCKFTTVSTSMLSTVFAIDYINLDYGEIGASYSFGVSGSAYGGGTGYVMMRFQKNALPSNPKKFVLPKAEPTEPSMPVEQQGNVREEYGVKNNTGKKLSPGQYKVSPIPLK